MGTYFLEDFLIACFLSTDGERVDIKDKKKLFKPNFLKQTEFKTKEIQRPL